jgi:hypothetical protein
MELPAIGLIQTEKHLSNFWDANEMLHVYGDVYFSDRTMDRMAKEVRPVTCFARIGGHQPKLPVWNEIFAWKINLDGRQRYQDALDLAIGALGERHVIGDAWLTFAALRNMTPEQMRIAVSSYNPNNRALFLNPLQQTPKPNTFHVQINDETDDWDYPDRLQKWRIAWGIY